MKNTHTHTQAHLCLILSLLLLIWGGINLHAQENTVQVNAPNAPDVSAALEYGEIPVGEFTGTANVNIPLGGTSYRGISLPVSLSYHSTGVRVSEEASSVGLGWNLSVGGSITRTIRGMDDFGEFSTKNGCQGEEDARYRNYYKITRNEGGIGEPTSDYYTYDYGYLRLPKCVEAAWGMNCGFQAPLQNYYFCYRNTPRDEESDLYRFSVLGYSGRFVIDKNGNPKLLDVQNVKIILNEETPVNSTSPNWKILLPNGIVATFGFTIESVQTTKTFSTTDDPNDNMQSQQCTIGDSYVSAWFLETLSLPRGNGTEDQHSVKFNYVQDGFIYPVPSFSEKGQKYMGGTGLICNENSPIDSIDYTGPLTTNFEIPQLPPFAQTIHTVTGVQYTNVLLENITHEYGAIDFLYSDRIDLRGARKLESVKTYAWKGAVPSEEGFPESNLTQQTNLAYEYFDADLMAYPNRNEKVFGEHITQGGTIQARFGFNDASFDNYDYTDNFLTKRLKLKGVSMIGDGSGTPLDYNFNYNGEEGESEADHLLPPKTAFAIDHFGYPNGKVTNNTLLPSVRGSFTFTGEFSVVNDGVVTEELHRFVNLSGADRNPDFDYQKAGLLKQISYPTAHDDFIEYESNEYAEMGFNEILQKAPEISAGNFSCTADSYPTPNGFTQISSPDDSDITLELSLKWRIQSPNSCPTTTCPGMLDPYPDPDHSNDPNHDHTAAPGFKYVLVNDQGDVIKTVLWDDLRNLGTASESSSGVVDAAEIVTLLVPPGRYRLLIQRTDPSGLNQIPCNVDVISSQLRYYLKEPYYTKLGGGARIKEIQSLDVLGGTSRTQLFDYSLENSDCETTTSGKITSGFTPLYFWQSMATFATFCGDQDNGEIADTLRYNFHLLDRFDSSIQPLTASSHSNYVGYSRVVKRFSEENEIGEVANYYINGGDDSDCFSAPVYYPYQAAINYSPFIHPSVGSRTRQEIYNKSGSIVQTSDFDYNFRVEETDILEFNKHWNHKKYGSTGFLFNDDEIIDPTFDGCAGNVYVLPIVFSYADVPTRVEPTITTQRTYDEENPSDYTESVTSITYDPENYVVSSQTQSGGAGESKTTSFKYATDFNTSMANALKGKGMVGVPIEVVAPNGATYETQYNLDWFVPNKFIEKYPSSAPITHTFINRFDRNGNPTRVINHGFDLPTYFGWSGGLMTSHTPHGRSMFISRYYYDAKRRLSRIIAPDRQKTKYTYDGHGRLRLTSARVGKIKEWRAYDFSRTSNSISYTLELDGLPDETGVTEYDGFGRELTSSVNGVVKSNNVYDNFGRLTSSLYMSGYGNTTYTYDDSPLRRVKATNAPGPGTQQTDYLVRNGDLTIRTTDELGRESYVSSDIFGRTTVIEDAMGNKTRYLGYTAFDAPLQVQPPLGDPYTYTYTNRRQLESKAIPGGGTTSYVYDNNNRLKSTMLANGTRIGVLYDNMGREEKTFLTGDASGGAPFTDNINQSKILTTTTYGTQKGANNNFGRVVETTAALIQPDGPDNTLGAPVTTEFTDFDGYGRSFKSTTTYELDGETYTETSEMGPDDIDMRDLVLKSGFSHAGADFSQETTYDIFRRPKNLTSTLDYTASFISTNMDPAMMSVQTAYNDADQLRSRKLMQASRGFYQEVYSYNERGWLESINEPNARSFDASLCDEPEGDVYETETTTEPTPLVDIFTDLAQGSPVGIPALDCEIEEPTGGECQVEIEVDDYSVVVINPIKKDRGLFANTALVQCPTGSNCSAIARSQNLASVEDIKIIGVGIDKGNGPTVLPLANTYSLNSILLATQQQGINKPALAAFRQDVLNAADNDGWFMHEVDFAVKSDANNCAPCVAEGNKNYGLSVNFKHSEAIITHLEVAYDYRTVTAGEKPFNYNWKLPTSGKGDRYPITLPCKKGKNASSVPNNSKSSGAAAGAEKRNPRLSRDAMEALKEQGWSNRLRGNNVGQNTASIEPPLHTQLSISPQKISGKDSARIIAVIAENCAPVAPVDDLIRASLWAKAQSEQALNGPQIVTRTISEILLRASATKQLHKLNENGLPFTIFQGELLEDLQRKNETEASRIEASLRAWITTRKGKVNELSVHIDAEGKLVLELTGNDLEFIQATYTSAFSLTLNCPDASEEVVVLEADADAQTAAQLLHRNNRYRGVLQREEGKIRGLATGQRLNIRPKETTTPVKKLTGTKCGTITEPTCSATQLSNQLEQVNNFYAATDQAYLDGLSYPTTLQSVMLCDGSIAYLLADQVAMLENGSYTVLRSLTLNSADDLITARTRSRNPNALFALSLDYERNGNIKEAQWKSTYFSPKKYNYGYDDLNRIESANYKQIASGPGSSLADDLFSVSGITYDAIGNIETLTRRGVTGCGPEMTTGEIDILTYNYPTTGDISRLESITDAAPSPKLSDQGVTPQTGGEYAYDGAGRMTVDPHRDLTIAYNHLDLPRTIGTPKGLVKITYDATGRKFLHELVDKYHRRYAGPLTFVKKDDEANYALEAAATGDGRLVFDADHEELYPEYHHKDHLGNVRLAFTDRNKDKLVEIIGDGNEVTQVMDFYPFGLQQQGEGVFGPVVESSNRFKYNGKEALAETGLYDYGARWYDPATARWGQVDPLAEKYTLYSPYNYTLNNPIRFIDPDGRKVILANKGHRALYLLAHSITFGEGESRLRGLISSNHTYRIHLTHRTKNSAYDWSGFLGRPRTVYSVGTSWWRDVEGGATNSEYLLYHELGHASQHNTGYDMTDKRLLEDGTVNATNKMRAIFGETKMRHKYGSLALYFSRDPNDYNRQGVQVRNFKELDYSETIKGNYLFFQYDYKDKESEGTRFGLIFSRSNGEVDFKKFNNREAYQVFLDLVRSYGQ